MNSVGGCRGFSQGNIPVFTYVLNTYSFNIISSGQALQIYLFHGIAARPKQLHVRNCNTSHTCSPLHSPAVCGEENVRDSLFEQQTGKNTLLRTQWFAKRWQSVVRGCKNPCRQVAVTTTLCTVATSICGSSVQNLLHATFLAPGIWSGSSTWEHLCTPDTGILTT